MQKSMISALLALAASIILSGCEKKADRVVGAWSARHLSVTFASDGTYVLRQQQTEERGTWSRFAQRLSLYPEGSAEEICELGTRMKNQLWFAENVSGPRCRLSGALWRTDLPEEARKSITTFDCKTNSQLVHEIQYTPQFRIEVDTEDHVACMGAAGSGCALIGYPARTWDDQLSIFMMWSDGTGDTFSTARNKAGELKLSQAFSNQCSLAGGMGSCIFGAGVEIGVCTRSN